MARQPALAVAAAGILAIVACQELKDRAAHVLHASSTQGAAALADPFPAGDPHGSHFHFELAVYHLRSPKIEPIGAVRRLAKDRPLIVSEGTPDATPDAPTLFVRAPSLADYAPPDIDSLRYSGRGLSEQDEQLLQSAPSVTALAFAGPQADALSTYRSALDLAAKLQRATGGLLWDEETREVFSPEAWQRRLQNWTEGVPNAQDHVTIHAYRDGELVRLVTLGMIKFGLPDVVVNDVASSAARPMASLVNLTCQLLVEGARLEPAGQMDVSIDALGCPICKEAFSRSLKPGATRRASLALSQGQTEEGDADNRLVEIAFPGPSSTLQERHNRLLLPLFGSSDGIVNVQHDAELLEASRRAKVAVLALKPRYREGSPDLETLLVKAPFDVPGGGTEWMWVEVVRWRGSTIEGILTNDPFKIPDLHAGARVGVREEDIFDYILHKADGTTEGNETGKLLE